MSTGTQAPLDTPSTLASRPASLHEDHTPHMSQNHMACTQAGAHTHAHMHTSSPTICAHDRQATHTGGNTPKRVPPNPDRELRSPAKCLSPGPKINNSFVV